MRGYELDELEREILRKFEGGELWNTPGIEREVEVALGAMPEEYTEISWLLSPCEMKLVRELAEKQGMSYQEWAADVVRKYLRGTLVDKVLPKMVNGEVDYQFDEEELEILEAFRRGDLQSVPDLERELEIAREAARNTLKNHTRVSMSLSPIELKIAIVKGKRRGAPYSLLVSHINGKYLRGMLIDKGQPQTVTAHARASSHRRTR